jgi:hypothetical protein
MVYLHTKNLVLGYILEDLGIEIVCIFCDHFEFLRSFVTFYGRLVYFVVIWYILSCFAMLYREKSGNPDLDPGCCGLVSSV